MRRRATQRSRGRLWFLGIVVPLAGLALIYPVRLALLRVWPPLIADAVIGLLVTGGVVAFSAAIFRLIGRQDRQLARQFAELEHRNATEGRLRAQYEALHQAALAVASAHTPEQILQRLVQLARDLSGARYAALGVLGPQGGINAFYTAGLTDGEHAQLGAPPQGHGLLGAILAEGATLRIPDIAQDPRRVGFPPGHPPMRSLLGVPVTHAGRVIGNLYLADRIAAGADPLAAASFRPEDERLLAMLAGHAAGVIEQARLAGQVGMLALASERARIRMDLHDGAIQAIYGVNLELETAVEEVASDPSAAQRRIDLAIDRLGEVMKDIRGYILGLELAPAAQSLPEALAALLAETRAHTLLETELHVEGDELLDLPPAMVRELLQMAREAVANVVRHARASRLWATLQARAHEVHLRVEDNGVGFDGRAPSSPGRDGLRNLRDRAHGLGGTLIVRSAPGAGTAVEVHMPLHAAAREEDHV